MKQLVILKRIEVWALFAVVAGLIGFALHSGPELDSSAPPEEVAVALPGPEAPEDGAGEQPREPGGLVVDGVEVVRFDDGRLVSVTLRGRPAGDDALEIDESTLAASTPDGERVRRFFAPFRETPRIAPGGDSTFTVDYWLESPDDSIRLEFKGQILQADLSPPASGG